MRWRKMILVSMALFSALLLSAQSRKLLEGRITSNDQQAVLMANVVAKNKQDSSILSFSFSLEDGSFQIELPIEASPFWLHISALGYKEQWIALNQDTLNLLQHQLQVVLATEIINMQTVVIKAAGPAIKVNKDTTEFRAASFADGSERKIGDLLKKLPGVSVGEDGSVFVNGRKVKKILVDGDDIWKGQSDLVTKHLPANVVDKIQSIDNYQDNAVLKGFEESGDIALNLTVKESLKFKNNLDLEGAWGVKQRNELELHDLALVQKTKIAVIASTNNTGNLYGLSDHHPNDSDASGSEQAPAAEIRTTAIQLEKLPTLQLASRRFANNQSMLGALSINRSLSNYLKLQNYFALSREQIRTEQNNQSTFFWGADTLFLREEIRNQYQPWRWSNHFSANYNGKPRINLDYHAKINGVMEQLDNQLNSSLNGFFQNAWQGKERYLEQQAKATLKLAERQVILLDVIHAQRKSPEYLKVSNWAQQEHSTTALSTAIQQAFIQLERLNVLAKSLIKWGPNLKLKNQLGYLQDWEVLDSRLSSTTLIQTPSPEDGFANDLKLIKRNLFLASGFTFQLHRFKLAGDLKIQQQEIDIQNLAQVQNTQQRWINLNPSFGFGWALKGMSKLFGTYSRGNSLATITDLVSGYILQGYRDFQRSRADQVQAQHETMVLGYFDFNLYKQSTFNVSLFRNVSNNAFGRFSNINSEYSFLTRTAIGQHKLLSLSISKDQLLSALATKIKLNGVVSLSSYPVGVNEQITIARTRSISGTLSLQSAFPGPFNTDAELRMGESQVVSQLGQSTNIFAQLKWNAKYKFTPWLRGGLHFDGFQKDWSDPLSRWLCFLDAELVASPKNKPYFFEIKGYNLTGLRWYETLSIGDAFQYYTVLRLNPTQVLFKVGYSF